MPTINQLIKKSRVKPIARNKVPALERQPLKRGVCVKVYTTTHTPLFKGCFSKAGTLFLANDLTLFFLNN